MEELFKSKSKLEIRLIFKEVMGRYGIKLTNLTKLRKTDFLPLLNEDRFKKYKEEITKELKKTKEDKKKEKEDEEDKKGMELLRRFESEILEHEIPKNLTTKRIIDVSKNYLRGYGNGDSNRRLESIIEEHNEHKYNVKKLIIRLLEELHPYVVEEIMGMV
jgi:hypothetical protein